MLYFLGEPAGSDLVSLFGDRDRLDASSCLGLFIPGGVSVTKDEMGRLKVVLSTVIILSENGFKLKCRNIKIASKDFLIINRLSK